MLSETPSAHFCEFPLLGEIPVPKQVRALTSYPRLLSKQRSGGGGKEACLVSEKAIVDKDAVEAVPQDLVGEGGGHRAVHPP